MAYWIKTVSEMTGIPKNTLIAWERRYGLVKPKRAESGYRLYTAEDVDLLRRVQRLTDAGHRISEAAEMVKRALPLGTEESGDLRSLEHALLDALLGFDRRAADRLGDRLVTWPFTRRVEEIYLPLLRRVGDGWEAGEISVAQEHFASAYCREQILAMTRTLEAAAGTREAVCATPSGELHEFGLLGAAFWLAGAGYRLVYLGADLPEAELVAIAAQRRPAIVAISAIREREDLDLLAFGRRLRKAVGEGRVLIGGAASEKLRGQGDGKLVFGATRSDI